MKKRVIVFLYILLSFFIISALLSEKIFCLKVNAAEQVGLAESPWPCESHDSRHSGQSPYIGAQSNTLKWSYQTDRRVNSSPVIDTDGTIYIESFDGNLYALNPDGSLKRIYLIGEEGISSAIIGADETIYVGGNKFIHAFNPDGTLKWTYNPGTWIIGSIVIGKDDMVYAINGFYGFFNNIYALNPDGTLEWSKHIDLYLIISLHNLSIGNNSHGINWTLCILIGYYSHETFSRFIF